VEESARCKRRAHLFRVDTALGGDKGCRPFPRTPFSASGIVPSLRFGSSQTANTQEFVLGIGRVKFVQLRTAVRFASVLFLASRPISACSCSFLDVPSAVRQADLIFRGKLVKVEYLDPLQSVPHEIFKDRMVSVPRRFLATLEVNGVWKGKVGRTIVLHTREGSSDCVGFWTDIGKEVLVFANQGVVTPKEPEVWRILEWTDKVPVGQTITSPGVCTLNDEIKDATGTLKKLGAPKPPASDR